MSQARTSYKDNVHEWKQKWLENKPMPSGLNGEVWKGFIEYWSLEETKALSNTNSKNRKGNKDKAIATHNAGAMTFESREQQMVRFSFS